MFNENLSKLLGIPNRLPEEPINDIHKNIICCTPIHLRKTFF